MLSAYRHKMRVAEHSTSVSELLSGFIADLIKRVGKHDRDKTIEPQLSLWIKTEDVEIPVSNLDNPNLKAAVEAHWKSSDHHPEHYENGISDMNLLTLVEMVVDWSARLDNNPNSIKAWMQSARERWDICPKFAKVLSNTIYLMKGL